MIDDPPVILGADGDPATPEPEQPVRIKATEREPLSVIQERLRKESSVRAAGRFRGRNGG